MEDSIAALVRERIPETDSREEVETMLRGCFQLVPWRRMSAKELKASGWWEGREEVEQLPEVREWVRERHEEKRRKMMEMMKQLQGLFCLGVCGRRGVSRYERKRVESILSKSVEKTTKSDIAALNAFLRQYESENEMRKPLMLLADVQSRLAELNGLELSANGVPMSGNVNSVPVTDYDKTVGKIKSEIYKMKTKIKRLYGEKDNLMEMAKDSRSNEALAVSYVRMAKKKEEQLKTTYGEDNA
ncbi:hypothetical protein BLSTO_03272 [Blastocystis sp. subtype 1]